LETLVPQNSKEDSGPPRPSSDIVISVDAGHSVRLNSEVMDLATLQARLISIYRNGSSRVAFVRGDKTLDFQDVASVIDLAKGAGAERIGLMTQ
jgi:biopolymer transport protein ExbD/biopolymer transport protein TolR